MVKTPSKAKIDNKNNTAFSRYVFSSIAKHFIFSPINNFMKPQIQVSNATELGFITASL